MSEELRDGSEAHDAVETAQDRLWWWVEDVCEPVRQATMVSAQQSLGDRLGFSSAADHEDLGRRFDFELFQNDSGGHAPCTLSGEVGETGVIPADYVHVPPAGVNETKTHPRTICIGFQPALALPHTTLWPEIHLSGLAAGIADNLGVPLGAESDLTSNCALVSAASRRDHESPATRSEGSPGQLNLHSPTAGPPGSDRAPLSRC